MSTFSSRVRIGLVGALATLVACPSPAPPPDVALDPPALGFQLTAGPFDVPAASEIQDCYYFRVPVATNVQRFEIAQNLGTHHMNLFRVSEPSPYDDGQIQRGCWDSLPFEEWGLLVNSQVEADAGQSLNWELPAGVVARLPAGELIMIQSHYVNASTQVTTNGRGKVVINFHGVPDSAVVHEMGTMFANNRNIFLRSGEESSFSSLCPLPDAVNLIAATGHFHSRGRLFTMAVADSTGTIGPEIYRNLSWDDPLFATYNAAPVSIPAGGGIVYRCDFYNDQPYDIVFGPHVEFEEHCNVFAYYYPRLTAQALYCF